MGEPGTKGVFSGVLLALIVFFVALPLGGIVVCAAIRKAAKDGAASKLSPAATSAIPGASAETVTPQPEEHIFSFALFSAHDELALCVDGDMTDKLDGGSWPEARKKAAAKLSAKDAGALLPGHTALALPGTCQQAFGDRVELAKCVDGTSTLRYYGFQFIKNDLEMRQCLEDSGDWSAVGHDSDEYRRAKVAYDLAEAQRRIDRYR